MLLPGERAAVMEFPRSLFPLLDSKRLARGSRIKLGKNVRIVGVPAILLGVAAIVAAAGAMKALQKAAPTLPETLREARSLWRTIRGDRRELSP